MKKSWIQMVFLAFALALLPQGTVAQETSKSNAEFAGNWQGEWIDASGYLYHAQMQLTAGSGNAILGKIEWTLEKSPSADEQTKLGMTGTEFIAGTYDSASRVLTFRGVSKSDPNNILGLDEYKILLATNANVLGGITLNNGSWRGLISLTRSVK